MKVICCLLVRNDEEIIEQWINELMPHVDEFVINDVGSDDRTPEIINTFMEEKKPPIHLLCDESFKNSISWVNGFNKILDYAEQLCDDTDFIMIPFAVSRYCHIKEHISLKEELSKIHDDIAAIQTYVYVTESTKCINYGFIRALRGIRYKGKYCEYLDSDDKYILEGVTFHSNM